MLLMSLGPVPDLDVVTGRRGGGALGFSLVGLRLALPEIEVEADRIGRSHCISVLLHTLDVLLAQHGELEGHITHAFADRHRSSLAIVICKSAFKGFRPIGTCECAPSQASRARHR